MIDTFCVASDMSSESVSAYIISMARNPSDVLAVELLKREARFLVSQFADAASSDEAGCRAACIGRLCMTLRMRSTALARDNVVGVELDCIDRMCPDSFCY